MELDKSAEKIMLRELRKLKAALQEVKGRKHIVRVPSDDIADFICSRLTPGERACVEIQVRGSWSGIASSFYIYDEAHAGKEY